MQQAVKISYGTVTQAVTLADVRAHLALAAIQTGMDGKISAAIPVAQEAVEDVARTLVSERTLTIRWRLSNEVTFCLPAGPLVSITSITHYFDGETAGVDVRSSYRVARYGGQGGRPEIVLDTPPARDADEVEVVAQVGHSTAPASLKMAIMQRTTDLVDWEGSTREMQVGRMARNLPGDWKRGLVEAGYPVYRV